MSERGSSGLASTKLDGWVTLLAVAAGGTLAWLSVARYQAYNAGMLDLGNMAQAIWSATQGRPLECTFGTGTLSRLAHHVELIYFLFAPLYAVLPSPVTLLVAQAGLYAFGSLPLYRLSLRRLSHKWAARMLVLTYLLYPVAQTSVLFDFHGDTLAMPLLLFAIEALDRRRHGRYAVWLALSLACKFYVSVPVIVFGAALILSGRRKVGALTSLAGAAWLIATLLVIRPLFADATYAPPESTLRGYLAVYFGTLSDLIRHPSQLVPRALTAFIVFVPGLWLGRYAPKWMMPAASVAVPALAASGLVSAYDYRWHHYALVVPFVLLSSVEGAARLRQLRPGSYVLDVGMQLAITLLFGALLVDVPLNPHYWRSTPGWGRDPWAYGVTARDELKDAWLAENVPDDVPVMASFFLASHLTNRSVLYLPQVREEPGLVSAEASLVERLDAVDYVVLDALFDYTAPSEVYSRAAAAGSPIGPSIGPGHPQPVLGGVRYDANALAAALRRPDLRVVSMRDGLVLFAKPHGLSQSGLRQEVGVTTVASSPDLLASFAGAIGLVSVEVVPLGARRYRLSYDWIPLRSLASDPAYVAVSRLAGTSSRFVHLPTQSFVPTTAWETGKLVREVIEMKIPDQVTTGEHPVAAGWYDSSHPHASATDARSRLGEEHHVALLQVAEAAGP